MAEIREISEEYTEIAAELINTMPELEYIRVSSVQIGFLSSDREKRGHKKTVYGECEKVPDKWRWSVPFDFTITVFEPNVEHFSDEQIRILILHELLHVGIELDGNEERYFIHPHEVEDFKLILERYGIDWQL